MRNRPAGEVRSGLCRPSTVMPARKNNVCLRFNSAGGSSPKLCKPSTCGFANAPCSGTAHAGFKTQTCAFFWAARDRGATNRVWKQRKAPDARGFPIASGAWGSARQRPARSVPQLCRVLGHGGPDRYGGPRTPQSRRALGVAGALFRAAS